MVFKWLDAGKAAEVGVALADDFVLRTAAPSGDSFAARRGASQEELPKFMQRFLQQVDRDTRPLKLNIFKRAKLANSFKWRLLEKGVEPQLVDELTQALVLRLTAGEGGAKPAGHGAVSSRRASARDAQALLARAEEALERREYETARESYQNLVNHYPRDALTHHGLGTALAQLARYQEAEQEFRRAIGLKPGLLQAHLNLAGVLQSTGRYDEAETPLRRALKLKPAYLDARISLGMTYLFLGRLKEARDCYEKALRGAQRNTRALVGLGQIEALEGRFDEAEAIYRRAIEADPEAPHAWAAVAALRKMTPADSGWVKRAEEIAGNGLAVLDEATLRFAIGKYYDDVGDFRRAFRSYQRANELHKLRAEPYDRKAHTRFIDDLVDARTAEAIAGASAIGSQSERPVFVLGMPRSGTSLVEQIIASHPLAHGAGELNFWQIVVRAHESGLRQGLLSEKLRHRFAEDYLKVLAGHSADALRVVDKAPINASYLGLIHAVFPRARIVFLQRDPIDTCLSCYFQQFPPSLNWSMDLGDLTHYYRETHRLRTHWRRVLPPEVVLEVPYAELVADQETWTRRILGFVGLPWDERCLDFYKTARAVNTASVWQVRQKIYQSSVQRWRNYEKFIGPLLELEGLD
jgi:tetratricopeptide (TPR) repeat protein